MQNYEDVAEVKLAICAGVTMSWGSSQLSWGHCGEAHAPQDLGTPSSTACHNFCVNSMGLSVAFHRARLGPLVAQQSFACVVVACHLASFVQALARREGQGTGPLCLPGPLPRQGRIFFWPGALGMMLTSVLYITVSMKSSYSSVRT